jgi:single-strand DNA-binding protein
MTSQNRVILTGRVVTSPRPHYRPDGSAVVQFSLEISCEAGQALINIVVIGGLAELKLNLLQAGQHLLVEGRLNQRRWQTPEGKHRTRMEVIATDLRRVDE